MLLFVPARLLLGLIFSLATVLLAVLHRPLEASPHSVGMLLARRGLHPRLRARCCRCSSSGAIPSAVLDVLLPTFASIARALAIR